MGGQGFNVVVEGTPSNYLCGAFPPHRARPPGELSRGGRADQRCPGRGAAGRRVRGGIMDLDHTDPAGPEGGRYPGARHRGVLRRLRAPPARAGAARDLGPGRPQASPRRSSPRGVSPRSAGGWQAAGYRPLGSTSRGRPVHRNRCGALRGQHPAHPWGNLPPQPGHLALA
jgi:hypothetical protein